MLNWDNHVSMPKQWNVFGEKCFKVHGEKLLHFISNWICLFCFHWCLFTVNLSVIENNIKMTYLTLIEWLYWSKTNIINVFLN